MKSLAIVVLVVALFSASDVFAAKQNTKPPKFGVTEIPRPQGDVEGCLPGYHFDVYAPRMNDTPYVVGYTDCYVESNGVVSKRGWRAFAWSAATGAVSLLPLPGLDLSASAAGEVNSSGDAVGYEKTASGAIVQVRWSVSGDASRPLDPLLDCGVLGSGNLIRAAINDSGDMAFRAQRSWGSYGYSTCVPVLVVADAYGQETTTGEPYFVPFAMNSSGVVAGNMGVGAVTWSAADAGVTILHENQLEELSAATNINDAGDVVGYILKATDSNGCATEGVGILWMANASGGVEEILLPESKRFPVGYPLDINPARQVVGARYMSGDCDPYLENGQAVLWQDGAAFDLNELIPSNSGVYLRSATSINGSGTILATGFVLSEGSLPCPEPADPARMCRPRHSFLMVPKKEMK